ncbi:hypothetical protein ONS95_015031 [Cadophora gregata]|uniref:uncharacterized protein n=1 Tax=Cadophora gregata TaxID=51156 RepID=UPI0026DBE019|nr:uncharacterized protein ONS95_015031 [Cadophora gregata]KAK0105078.1 hypothetical protein ONS96_004481 [Cadophora gregata f. sp. sojae]KAK0106053.1 hypothetical protein ONS95_015031 [Cadophora gregata]
MVPPTALVAALVLDLLAIKAYGIGPRYFNCPTDPKNLNPVLPQFACPVSFGGYAEGGFGTGNVAGAPADYDTGGDPQDGPKDNAVSDTPDGPLRKTLTCNYRNVETAPFGGLICNYELTGALFQPNNYGCPELCPVAVSSSTRTPTSTPTRTSSALSTTTPARCFSNKAKVGRLCEVYGDISDVGGSICPGFRNIKDSFINGLQGVINAAETNNRANPAKVQALNNFKYAFFTTIAASLGVAAAIAEAPVLAIGVAAVEAFTVYCDIVGYVSLISSACNIVKNKFACPNPRMTRSVPFELAPAFQPRALAPRVDNPCTNFLPMLPPASICASLPPLEDCSLTLADYVEGGISPEEAQPLIDACPRILKSQQDLQTLCVLRQAVADFEPFCGPDPYVPSSNSTVNCPTGRCNGTVTVVDYVTLVTCNVCAGGSATVQPAKTIPCIACPGGSSTIPPYYEAPCSTCPGGSSTVIVSDQPQATVPVGNPPKYTDVTLFTSAAASSEGSINLAAVVALVLYGLIIV